MQLKSDIKSRPSLVQDNTTIQYHSFTDLRETTVTQDVTRFCVVYASSEEHSLVAVRVHPALKIIFELQFILSVQNEPQEQIANGTANLAVYWQFKFVSKNEL